MALIALGVTGGIGAYKAVEVARGLQTAGHEVVAVMTHAAQRFVGPLTFEAITRRRVVTDQFAPGANADIEHIALASDIAALVVAPATANIIGKFAAGIADDALTSLYLATRAPVILAPAMNTQMLEHPAVEDNLAGLVRRGVRLVEPGDGYLACGWMGRGRLADPEVIVAAVLAVVSPGGALSGCRVLVTAGPTHEAIDPVRYLGNRSSGRMGYALAEEALGRGADVVLVSGPTSLPEPAGARVIRVRSAEQMHGAVRAEASEADVVIMAAAVADYTPIEVASGKIAKTADVLTLELRRTTDILGELGRTRRPGQLLVGFAAETEQLVSRARHKRESKAVDLIVANDVSRSDAGFDSDRNAVTLVSASGEVNVPLQAKRGVARAILDHVIRMRTPESTSAPALAKAP